MSIKVTNKNVNTNTLENKLIIRQKLISTKKSNAIIFKRRKINRKKKKKVYVKKKVFQNQVLNDVVKKVYFITN